MADIQPTQQPQSNNVNSAAPNLSLSGGGTLFGSMLSLIGNFMAMEEANDQAKIQRDFTRELTQWNQNFQREQMATQHQYNLADWNMQNAYNTPAAQVDRLSQAGFNPSVFSGDNTAGAISGTSALGGSPIDATKENRSPEYMSKAFSQLGEMIGRATDEIPLLRAQAKKEKAQARMFDEQGDLYNASGKKIDAETQTILQQLGFTKDANLFLQENGFGFYSNPLNPFDMRLTPDAQHTKYTALNQKYSPFGFVAAWERIGSLNSMLTKTDVDINDKSLDIGIKALEKTIREAQWADPQSKEALTKMPWSEFKKNIAEQKRLLQECSLLKQQQSYYHSLTGYYNVLQDNEQMLLPWKIQGMQNHAEYEHELAKNQPFVRYVALKQGRYFESSAFHNNVDALRIWSDKWNRHEKLFFQIQDYLELAKIGVDVMNGLGQAYYFFGAGTNQFNQAKNFNNMFKPTSLIMPQSSGSFDMSPFILQGLNALK